jgi:hypothetical protein
MYADNYHIVVVIAVLSYHCKIKEAEQEASLSSIFSVILIHISECVFVDFAEMLYNVLKDLIE